MRRPAPPQERRCTHPAASRREIACDNRDSEPRVWMARSLITRKRSGASDSPTRIWYSNRLSPASCFSWASRRAGINLNRIRVIAFTLCGLTAGIMGIIFASYLGSVSTGVQGGQNVLLGVAAGVIGGTSLFGGRGKMVGAVLGGFIVAVIYNGLELLGLGAAPQNIWTAVVLLAAVTVDTLARRRSTAA